MIEEDAGRRPVTCLDAVHAGLVFDYNGYNKAVDAEETGANDVVGDPELADTSGTTAASFRPSAASPCLAVGVDAGTYTDYQGTVRPSMGGYDMGAFQRQAKSALRHRTIKA